MEYKIYLIEDWKGLKYVGSTKKTLNERLSVHKSDKKRGKYCSSSKLNLDDCKIICIDECNKEDKKDKEAYWINKIDTVNDLRLNIDYEEYNKEYYKDNKEYYKEHNKEYYKNNKEKYKEYYKKNKEYYKNNKEYKKEYQKEYRQNNKEKIKEYHKEYDVYQKSWGGDSRYNNNLLKIDVNIFL